MFSLILPVLGVILVTATTAATVHYGGSSMHKGNIAAEASAYINTAVQVKGALDLYANDKGLTLREIDDSYSHLDRPFDNKEFMKALIAEGFLKDHPRVKSHKDIPYDLVWSLNTWYNFDNDGKYNDWVLQAAGVTQEMCDWLNHHGARGLGNGPYLCDEWSVPGEPDPDEPNAPYYYHGLTYIIKHNQ